VLEPHRKVGGFGFHTFCLVQEGMKIVSCVNDFRNPLAG
jgi:hypothetical protein